MRNLILVGNPLAALVLSEVEVVNLAETVATLRAQGVSIFTYPLTARLVEPKWLTGAFQFGIGGPPAVYTILASSNLVTWTALGTTTNTLGTNSFTDPSAQFSGRKFYRARSN